MAADPTATTRTRIHVGGLGQSVNSDDLRKIFSAAGMVEGVDIVRTKGRSFAYVDILPSTSNSISKLFSTYNGCAWKGGKLKLEKAKEHFLTRLKREWAEAEAEDEANEGSHQAKPSSSDSNNSKNKVQVSQNNQLRIFFPRLSKIKSLPFSGTGKHRYSFQRVEAPAFPLHFCDCVEHSGRFNAVKQKEVRHHEEINDGMNEEELSLMSSVMNKLFERENISNTSRSAIVKERDNFIEPVEDSPSNEEENDDDDDDLIINVVSNAKKRTAMSGIRESKKVSTEKTRLSENKVSKDGAIPSASKLQKKNAVHAEKKRKPNRDDKHEIPSLSSQLRMNSQCDEIEAGFEEDDETDDDLVINVASTENKGKALSGSTKRAKVSPKQNFKLSETQSNENECEEKKDRLLPRKKMKLISTKERDGNEAVSTVPAEKGPLIAQMTEQDCSLKPLSTSCLWSQKSSWKALVGGRGDSAFSLSNILQNADTTEEQHVFDDPKVDNTLDSKNDKLSTPENSEGMSDKMEIANAIAEAQSNKPSMTSSNTGRGSSWLHKSSWIQLVSDKSNSFSISQILPGTTTSQELAKPTGEDVVQSADGNYTNEMDRFTTEGVGKGDFVESIPETNPQTLEGSNDTSLPAVENISNFEPVKGFAVDTSTVGTCSFMRSSTSLKEWAKTKAALKGSRKKKTKLRDGENDSKARRKDTQEESSESSDKSEEERRAKRDRSGKRDRRHRHDTGHRDWHNDKQREEDRYRNRDWWRHSRHDSDDDDRGRRSHRNTELENRSQRRDNDNQPSRRDRADNSFKEKEEGEIKQKQPAFQQTNLNGDTSNLGRSGGVYIPPFKLARMMKETQDKSSVEYQRLTWDALRKSINGLVNKVNATNIKNIIPELFAENLIRGRGLFCRSCMKSQMASPGFTDVFAALVAVVNTKFPEVGELLLRRIVLQLKRAYKRNDKPQLLAAVKFVAHLVNQQVAHEIIALELLTVLLENPTDDSVEVAVGFVTECGSLLQDLSPKGLHGIFERFRGILHEGEIDKRVQFLIEGLFAIRKAKFQGYPAVRPELDLVEQEDQLTHEISLQDEIDPEITLDIFKPDPLFLENEKRYEELKKTILGEDSEDEEGSDAGSGDEDDDEDDDESDEEDEEQMKIQDETETNLINLRRTIYLTIMSSVDFEEAGHKLLKIKLEPGQEMELCIMLLECCSQERTYLRYYGLLGQRFCMINKVYQENFDKCFVQQYSMIHRLETNKLRNVAKFFAHLLGTDALPWHVLAYIRLTEEDTTSSSRIFIKILFQELSEHLGIRRLNERLSDPTMQDSVESIFPRDNPKNTRFSINFFTSIGLGGITENLREYLKNMPRLIMQQQEPASESESGDESGSSSSSDSESASSEPESDSSSSDEGERRRKKRRK